MNEMPHKKKILYIITKSNFGGAQRYVYDLAVHMSKTYGVAVACGGNGVLTHMLKEAGIPVYEVKSFERDIHLMKEIHAWRELYTIIRSYNPDILHVNSSKAAGLGALIGRTLGVPRIIFTAHGWPFYEPRSIIWRTFTWFFSYFTVICSHKTIVVSLHDYDKHMMPFQSHKIVHINTAVPNIPFKERLEARSLLFSSDMQEKHTNDIWAVTTSELNHNKNILMLLTAVAEVNKNQKQKIFLTLIGDGDEREMLKHYVKENHMENMFVFLGFLQNAREYLKAFDIFLLPSLKEGLPYGLLEAGAAGLYCIASEVGGVPSVIENKDYGVLIEPNNKEELVAALQEIPPDTSYIVASLQEKIQVDFSEDLMLRNTETLYG